MIGPSVIKELGLNRVQFELFYVEFFFLTFGSRKTQTHIYMLHPSIVVIRPHSYITRL